MLMMNSLSCYYLTLCRYLSLFNNKVLKSFDIHHGRIVHSLCDDGDDDEPDGDVNPAEHLPGCWMTKRPDDDDDGWP